MTARYKSGYDVLFVIHEIDYRVGLKCFREQLQCELSLYVEVILCQNYVSVSDEPGISLTSHRVILDTADINT